MYHIKNDKRAYKSAILISESLADMLKEKKYDEISITDVCVARGVARTTFYRLFDTLDDVLIYQFDTLFEESIKQFTSVTNMGKSFARFMVEIAMNNRALVTAIVESGRSDLFDFSTRAKELCLWALIIKKPDCVGISYFPQQQSSSHSSSSLQQSQSQSPSQPCLE